MAFQPFVTVHFLLSLDVKEGQVVSTEEVVSLLWEMMLFYMSNTLYQTRITFRISTLLHIPVIDLCVYSIFFCVTDRLNTT